MAVLWQRGLFWGLFWWVFSNPKMVAILLYGCFAFFKPWEETRYFSAINSSNIKIHKGMMRAGWERNLARSTSTKNGREGNYSYKNLYDNFVELSSNYFGKQ